ncbi:nuclear transport factor 2 family protein [Erythrobacter dokdonensis]|uniref:SnoaL-like domain-containing protein n=1 Tax=Erythrobacter dokdonensis DSW-74 TaxID=1300349 RepID=A0A1A7BK17_9SPHN|nr:nuclear transport factor 2 family protein [Erythrobacter dokdonensis]OBV12071.1 hypothetical protein I603_0202 [Erythrobacter dokdonensis DSW-74]
MSNTDLAEHLFTALQNNDMDTTRDCCAPDFRGSQNGGPEMSLDALLQFAGAVNAALPDFRYENPIRTTTDSGFVEEHLVRASRPDGGQLSVMVCVVAEVSNGKITTLREYVYTGAAAGLLKALGR